VTSTLDDLGIAEEDCSARLLTVFKTGLAGMAFARGFDSISRPVLNLATTYRNS
jgi:hypothetical protein